MFEKPILFTLGLGLTTPYSLRLLVWKFYQTFVIVCIEFWLRFKPQNSLTRFSINILFITVRVERKIRLCVKLFDFLPKWILIRLRWNLSRFSQIQSRFLRGIPGKNYFGTIFLKFCEKPRISSSKICEISPYFLQFYSVLKISLKNLHKFFRVLLAPY